MTCDAGQVAGVHAQQTRFTAAEALYKQALEIFEATFGKVHRSQNLGPRISLWPIG